MRRPRCTWHVWTVGSKAQTAHTHTPPAPVLYPTPLFTGPGCGELRRTHRNSGGQAAEEALNLSGNHGHCPQPKHHLQLRVCSKQLFKQAATHRSCRCGTTVRDPTSILKDRKSHWLKPKTKDCGIILGYILQPSPLLFLK